MTEPAWLTLEAVLAFHEQLVAEHGGSALLRDRGLLESALASPKNHFAYGEQDLHVLATAYANSITRNHPFVDGNKRAALIAAYTFLGINGLDLVAPEAEAVHFVEGLSTRAVSEEEFAKWLQRSCVPRQEAAKKPGRRRKDAQTRRRREGDA